MKNKIKVRINNGFSKKTRRKQLEEGVNKPLEEQIKIL